MRTPEFLDIRLHDLMLLLTYKWAAVNSNSVGELGTETYETLCADLDAQCSVRIRPTQLADLLYHMREVVFGQLKPATLQFTIRNHNKIMRKLKGKNPEMFKELSSGEIVMNELEERVYE